MPRRTEPTPRRAYLGSTRGGYPSSSKPVSELKPPPSGPAPGAAKPAHTTDDEKEAVGSRDAS